MQFSFNVVQTQILVHKDNWRHCSYHAFNSSYLNHQIFFSDKRFSLNWFYDEGMNYNPVISADVLKSSSLIFSELWDGHPQYVYAYNIFGNASEIGSEFLIKASSTGWIEVSFVLRLRVVKFWSLEIRIWILFFQFFYTCVILYLFSTFNSKKPSKSFGILF